MFICNIISHKNGKLYGISKFYNIIIINYYYIINVIMDYKKV